MLMGKVCEAAPCATMASLSLADRGLNHVELTHPLHAYMTAVGTRPSPALRALRAETIRVTGRMWGMISAPETAGLLAFLVQLTGAERALEVGTFTGYATLALAEALPAGGVVVTCEADENWARVGAPFWAQAGVADRIDLRLGDALATLAGLEPASFDLCFVDADKGNYGAYYERALALLRPGGLLVIDNVLWNGQVADDQCVDEDTVALRALNAAIHGDDRVSVVMLPVGDGTTLCRKRQ
jgi:O-methyltransferase